MFNSTKDKIFTNKNYRKFTQELINKYAKKIKLITACPDCKAVVGLNGFGLLVNAEEKPEAMVMGCRECDHLFVTPVFI